MKKTHLLFKIMKFSCFGFMLQLIFLGLVSAFDGNAQQPLSVREVYISLKLHDASLAEVFDAIEKETEYVFNYDDRVLKGNKTKIDLKGKKSVAETLLLISELANVKFKQVNNNINVEQIKGNSRKVEQLKIILQTRNITGTITAMDEGEGLPGVNVVEKGTSNGTVTDISGKYSLEVSDGATLVFSSVGYTTEEVQIGNRSVIDLQMAQDIQQLQELVVIGYGEQQRRDVTGAVSSVDAKEFEDEAISTVSQGLQGKVAGVNVTMSSGAPGGNMIVRIRGNNSVIGSNDPLYVIDGFPVQSGTSGNTNLLSTLNPGNIQSIEVLKDASATAIYGARGSNGVILITTKQGSAGQHNIDFETSVGFRELENKIDMMNSTQFMELANERQTNDGNEPTFSSSDISSLSQTNTDWQDEIFRPALMTNHTLRFSGGNDNTRYLVSGNYFDEEGIIVGSDFKRGSLRLNLDQDLSEKFTLSSRLMLSRSVNNEIDESLVLISALQAPPFFTPTNDDGTYLSAAELKPFPFSPSTGDNPVAVAKERLNRRKLDRVLANVTGSYEIVENLTARVLLGVDYLNNQGDFYSPRIVESGLPAGSGTRSINGSTSFLNENTLNYKKTLRENDQLNVTVGLTWQQESAESLSGSASGFVSDDLENNILGAGEFFAAPNTGYSEWTILSYLGRINYSLNDKYLFTVSGRRDGSSRFGEGNKWAFFPSGAIAWRMSEENFIKNSLPQVSDLKLRVSWGVVGNQAIAPFQSLQRFSDVGLAFGGTPTTGFAAANLGNPDLKWETTEEFNVGLEVGLWDHRLSFSADYYVKNTSDLLALVNLPPTAGFTSTLQNIGSTRNSGVEFNIGADVIRGSKLTWDVNFNIAGNRNEVTETAGGQDIVGPTMNILGSANIVREGEPLSAFYGLQTDGLTEDGLFNFVDQNNDGEINNLDRVIIGNPYADYFYGFATNLNYGNFSFRASIQGELGKQLWNNNRYRFMSSMHRGNNAVADAVNRWSPSNPNQNAEYPRATSTLNQEPSDWYIEDASYLRLQNVRISYNLPIGNLNIPAIRMASIFLSGQNLLTLTGYSWYTPDVNSWNSGDLRIGIDQRSYPTTRTFTLGLKVGL